MSEEEEIEQILADYDETIDALLSCSLTRKDQKCYDCPDLDDCPKFLRECIATALIFIRDLIASKQSISEQFAERLHQTSSKLDKTNPDKGMYL